MSYRHQYLNGIYDVDQLDPLEKFNTNEYGVPVVFDRLPEKAILDHGNVLTVMTPISVERGVINSNPSPTEISIAHQTAQELPARSFAPAKKVVASTDLQPPSSGANITQDIIDAAQVINPAMNLTPGLGPLVTAHQIAKRHATTKQVAPIEEAKKGKGTGLILLGLFIIGGALVLKESNNSNTSKKSSGMGSTPKRKTRSRKSAKVTFN